MSSNSTPERSENYPGRQESELTDSYVIDADFHTTFEFELDNITPYIDGGDVKTLLEQNGWNEPDMFDAHSPFYSTSAEEGSEGPRGVNTREEIAEVMDKFSLDVLVANPPLTPILPGSGYPVMASKLSKAINDYMVDHIMDSDQGIYVSMNLPQWAPDEAAEEVNRIGHHDGVLGAQSFQGNWKLLGAYEFDPLFEELVSNDLPLLQHPAHSIPSSVFQNSRVTYVETAAIDWSYYAMVNSANMIFSGVFDNFPALNVVMQEGGTNWITTLARRADEFYQIYPEELPITSRINKSGNKYLEKMPSEYLFENFFVTTQPIALPPNNQINSWLDLTHADEMFIFSTDYPHYSLDTANWLFDNRINEETREQILNGNAQKVFNI